MNKVFNFGKGHIIILIALLGLLLVVGPASGTPVETAPTFGFWYYVGGETVSLPLATDEVAVRLTTRMTTGDMRAMLVGIDGVDSGADLDFIPTPDLALVKLEPSLDQSGVLQVP